MEVQVHSLQQVPQWGIMILAMSELKPLKQLRLNLGLSQQEAARYLGMPLNTLQNYEQGTREPSQWELCLLLDRLSAFPKDSEIRYSPTRGVYPLGNLCQILIPPLKQRSVEKAYLFGSYAKGLARGESDVDLFVVTSLRGLAFFGLRQSLEEILHKDVDLLSADTIEKDSRIENEILSTGIRIL